MPAPSTLQEVALEEVKVIVGVAFKGTVTVELFEVDETNVDGVAVRLTVGMWHCSFIVTGQSADAEKAPPSTLTWAVCVPALEKEFVQVEFDPVHAPVQS